MRITIHRECRRAEVTDLDRLACVNLPMSLSRKGWLSGELGSGQHHLARSHAGVDGDLGLGMSEQPGVILVRVREQDRIWSGASFIEQPRHVGKDSSLSEFLSRLSSQRCRIVRLPIFIEQRHPDIQDDPAVVGRQLDTIPANLVRASVDRDPHVAQTF